MNIALLGFGTVGKAFYELTLGRSDLRVTSVLSRRPRPELPCTVTNDFDEIVRDRSVGIVVEVMGGLEPAYRYICAAMRAGKHVVTANKQLMCAHFEELTSLAKEKGVALRCTAAAGGGIPWLTSLSRASELDEIKAVEGILNGTTNYMLSAMTNSGADYAPALRKAQELGYAEADPTADVEGLDARRKIVLSADLAFGVNIREEDIPCVGISSITAGDIAKAKDEGLTYKLIARAEKSGRAVAAFVCPTLFPSSAPEAHTDGTGNLATLYAARFGRQSFSGAGAGGPIELQNEVDALRAGKSYAPKVFAHQIAYNVIPQIGGEQCDGYTSEEMKLQNEGRKILHLPDMNVSCTCVRVPVVRSHSISAAVHFVHHISVDEARAAIAAAPGCRLVDDLDALQYPMPLDTSDQDLVFVGRIRPDLTDPNGLCLWCCGDQVRKGAATNCVQIAELLIQNG